MSSRSNKTRLDELLVQLGHATDVEAAARLVMAGRVKLSGSDAAAVLTPGMRVSSDAEVIVAEPPRFVSRGGLKLERGLDEFEIDVTGMVALDLGASTGGFTDCLLQRGAIRVYAVDSGRAQLHAQLVADPRVKSMERTNARKGFTLPEKVQVIVADLSFISLLAVLPQNMEHLESGGHCIALLKPQFEAERTEVPRGGVIEDAATVDALVARFRQNAAALGLEITGIVESPIRGDRGNREFLVRIVRAEPR